MEFGSSCKGLTKIETKKCSLDVEAFYNSMLVRMEPPGNYCNATFCDIEFNLLSSK